MFAVKIVYSVMVCVEDQSFIFDILITVMHPDINDKKWFLV